MQHLNQKQHAAMLAVLLFTYSVVATFSYINDTFNYLSRLCIVYMTGAYIRMYPCKWFASKRIAGFSAFIAIGLMAASILAVDFIGAKIGFTQYYIMCSNANKLLPFAGAVSLFLLFKNIRMKPSKMINLFSASAFGVLCIHAHSDVMRAWLWKDLLKNTDYYHSPYLLLHAVGSVILIYVICALIDMVRIYALEKPFFKQVEKAEPKLKRFFDKITGAVMKAFQAETEKK